MTRRRDPNSWTVVRLPERDLAEVVLELAAPLLERLGPAPSIEDARGAVELAVAFWNASMRASKLWEHPRVKELNELRKRMNGRQATQGDATIFDLLTECRRSHWLDPGSSRAGRTTRMTRARGASCARSDSPTAYGPRFRRRSQPYLSEMAQFVARLISLFGAIITSLVTTL
jgi:hypothetical protein